MVLFVWGVVDFEFCVVYVGALWLSATVLFADLHGLLLFALRWTCGLCCVCFDVGYGLPVVGGCAYIIICRFLLGVLPLCFVD